MHTIISADGTRIAYDKIGRGPALILVAGAFSYRKFPGQVKLAELLSPLFTVYNYDRRGRGDSGDTLPYAIEREIEDLQAMIEAAGGSAHVWGLSSGAVLALQAAAKGAAIAKLALHEPPFVVEATDRKPPADFAAHVAELIASARRSAGRGDQLFYDQGDGRAFPRRRADAHHAGRVAEAYGRGPHAALRRGFAGRLHGRQAASGPVVERRHDADAGA